MLGVTTRVVEASLQGLLQLGDQAPRHRRGVRGRAYPRQNHDELIAAEPGDVIVARCRLRVGCGTLIGTQRMPHAGRHQA